MDLACPMLLDLYGTAQCESRWTAVLDHICAELGVGSAVAQLFEHRQDRLAELWTARDTGSLAQAALHDRCVNRPDNPRLDRTLIARMPGEVGSDLRLFERASPLLGLLRGRLRECGLGDGIWATFPIGNRRHFTLIVHRKPGDAQDVEETGERFLHMLLPHLKQAVGLNAEFARIKARAGHFEAGLEQLRAGIILCSGDLEVEWYNDAAARILQTSPALRVEGGQLWCRGRDDARRLRAHASALAAGAQPSAAMVLGESGEGSVHVRLVRMDREEAGARWSGVEAPVALFLSHSAMAPRFDPAEIAILFALTPAEARLAAALASGKTLAQFAAERGVSLGTARIQLKHVLAKTGSGRQSDLVRQLCGSVAAVS